MCSARCLSNRPYVLIFNARHPVARSMAVPRLLEAERCLVDARQGWRAPVSGQPWTAAAQPGQCKHRSSESFKQRTEAVQHLSGDKELLRTMLQSDSPNPGWSRVCIASISVTSFCDCETIPVFGAACIGARSGGHACTTPSLCEAKVSLSTIS